MTGRRASKHQRHRREHPSNEIIDHLNVRYRVCDLFKKKNESNDSDADDNICECGFPKSQHKEEERDFERPWTIPYNTLERIDPVYGLIRYRSPFVRLAIDTPLEKVERILLEGWNIPKPRFIVSIIGGGKYFKLNDRLETDFIRGMIEIAQKSDAWLLTTGYNVGIVNLVGQAINKIKLTKTNTKITAIGICKWGCVTNVEYETSSSTDEPKKKPTDKRTFGKKDSDKEEAELELNHSHYLMLDDGTTGKYDTKAYRTELAVHMARLQRDDDITTPVVTIVVEGGKETIADVYYDLRENVPVILLNGSGRAEDFFNRCLLLTKDLENDPKCREDHGLIVINKMNLNNFIWMDAPDMPLFNGASRSFLSFIYQKLFKKYPPVFFFEMASSTTPYTTDVDWKHSKLRKKFEKYEAQLMEKLQALVSKEEIGIQHLKYVMYCLQPAVRSDITVFNLASDSDLSEIILQSICRSREKLLDRKEEERIVLEEIDQHRSGIQQSASQKRKKSKSRADIRRKDQQVDRSRLLDLAINWNCSDVAKEFILKNSVDSIININPKFEKALENNLPLFIYEFLKFDIDLYDLFSSKDKPAEGEPQYQVFLQKMYTTETMLNHKKNHLKHFLNGMKIDTVDILNYTLNDLIGENMHRLYFMSRQKENKYQVQKGLKHEQELSDEDQRERMQDYFMRDLFLWSILTNRVDMAKALLAHMKYRICPALIATKILKKYSRKAVYGELKKGYDASSKYFEQYAIDCIHICQNKNLERACEIVLQRNELYGYVTCLQIAARAKDELFIATECCVQATRNVWYNQLYFPSTTQCLINLFLGSLSLGIFAPFMASYRTTKKTIFLIYQDIKQIERFDFKMRANGIHYGDPALLEYPVRPSTELFYSRYWEKLLKFHESSPVKLIYRLITYLFFLLLFSYVLLFKFSLPSNHIPSIDWTEILTILLVSCMLIEEMRSFFSQDNLSLVGRINEYFTDLFKLMTFISLTLFYIGLTLRFAHASSEQDFTAARIVMALDLELWWLRSISFISIIPLLGPHLVSIGKMLKDLAFFICIIAIVMIGYGVASRSMAYYPVANRFLNKTNETIDASFDGRAVFRQVFSPVYYMMYGSFDNELAALDRDRNAGWSIATYILFSIHMILINILLVNMLIAIFSKRFNEVYDDIQNIWHSQRYALAREYYMRAPFFPPISLFIDIYYLCRMLYFFIMTKFFHKSADYDALVFQIIPVKETTARKWCEFEEKATREYAHNEVKKLKKTPTKSSIRADEKAEETQKTIAEIKNNTTNTIDGLKKAEDSLAHVNNIIEQLRIGESRK